MVGRSVDSSDCQSSGPGKGWNCLCSRFYGQPCSLAGRLRSVIVSTAYKIHRDTGWYKSRWHIHLLPSSYSRLKRVPTFMPRIIHEITFGRRTEGQPRWYNSRVRTGKVDHGFPDGDRQTSSWIPICDCCRSIRGFAWCVGSHKICRRTAFDKSVGLIAVGDPETVGKRKCANTTTKSKILHISSFKLTHRTWMLSKPSCSCTLQT